MFLCHDGFMADNEFEIKAKLTADTKGAKEATQALKEVKKSVDEVTQSTNHTTGDDTFERYAKSAQKAKSQFLELKAALKAMREELSAMGDDPYAKANLGTIADFEKLMPQKSAFSSQNVVELDEATRKVKELTQAFDQLMDTGRQMTVDPSAEVEKVIKAHEKRIDAAEKAYDREEKASAKAAAKSAADEEQKRLAAEKYFSSYMNGQKRIAATLQELQAEYGKYIQKLNEARAAGDRDGAKDAIANLRQLKSQMASVERHAEVYNHRMAVTIRRFTGISRGALNAASALSGLSGSMGTLSKGLGNIASGAVFGGVWGAAFGAVTTGIELLVQHMNEKTEEAKKSLSELEEFAKRVKEEQSKLGNEATENYYEGVLDRTLRKEEAITEELKRQLGYIQKKIDLESGFADDEAEIQRLGVEKDYINGKIGRGERDLRLARIEMEAGKKRRDFEEKKAQAAVDTAQKARDNAQKAYDESSKDVSVFSDDRVLGQGEASRLAKLIEGREAQMKELLEQMTSDSQISYLTGLLEESEKYYGVDSPQYRSIRDKIADRRLQFLKPMEVMHGQNLEDQGKLDRSDEALRAAGFQTGYKPEDHDKAIEAYWKKHNDFFKKTEDASKKLDQADLALNDSLDSLDLLQRRNDSRSRVDEARYKNVETSVAVEREREAAMKEIETLRGQIANLRREKQSLQQAQRGKRSGNDIAEQALDKDILRLGESGMKQIGDPNSSLGNLLAALRTKGKDGMIDGQEQAELLRSLDEWVKEFTKGKTPTREQNNAIKRITDMIRRFIALTNDAKGETNKEIEDIDSRITGLEDRIKELGNRKFGAGVSSNGSMPSSGLRVATGNETTKVREITEQIAHSIPEQQPLDVSEIVNGIMNLSGTFIQKFAEAHTSNQSAIDSAGSQIASLNDAVSKLDASLKITNKTAERADRTATQLMNWKKFNSRI